MGAGGSELSRVRTRGVVGLAFHLSLGSLGACVEAPAAPPDVLLITVDTTRADALGVYGRSPSPTPNLDALAAEGLRFDEAMTVAPLTLPAHTSLLTGRYPDRTGLRDNEAASLSPAVPTLATRLQAAGWNTGAFVSAAVLDSVFGLDRGFDVYRDDFDPTRNELDVLVAERPASETVDAALSWWASLEEGPRLTWVHLYDPHHPLQAPEPHASAWHDPYLAEVASMDAEIARLLAARRGGWVVVAGDHGEGNGEHGERFHGVFVYRSTMRVPLLLSGPGLESGVVERVVSLVDVVPTLLELLGVQPLEEADGRSLLAEHTRGVYGETLHGMHQFGLAPLAVWQDEVHRSIDAPRPEVYAWRSDPDERYNLWTVSPGVPGLASLEAFRTRREAVAPVAASGDVSAQLAALGYLSAPPVAVDGPLPDPKDHPDIVARTEALIVAARTRPPAEAVPLLRAFLVEYPGVGVAWALLARALGLAGQHAEAVEVLAELHARRPEDAAVLSEWGEQLMALGRWDEARARLGEAVALRPSDPVPHGLLAELARRQGDCLTARAHWEAGLAGSPEASRLWLVRGACAEEAGELEAAAADYDAVLAVEPDNPDARMRRALVAAQLGEAQATSRLETVAGPGAVEASRALGALYYEQGRYPEAVGALSPLWPLGQLDVHGLRMLADARLRTEGATAEVDVLLDQAVLLDPTDAEVLTVRAQWWMEQGEVEQAIAVQRQARELLTTAASP